MYKSLKSLGFKNVVVLCDNNLSGMVDDIEIYNELNEKGILTTVESGNTADEWLIRFQRDKDVYIVSRDRFKDFRKSNPSLKGHVIKFHIAGNEATFVETIYKVIDGISVDRNFPHLCRQDIDLHQHS